MWARASVVQAQRHIHSCLAERAGDIVARPPSACGSPAPDVAAKCCKRRTVQRSRPRSRFRGPFQERLAMLRCYSDPLGGDEFAAANPWIDDQLYTEIIRKLPIACSDAVLTLQGDRACYLANRVVWPGRGIWCLGGRIWSTCKSPTDSVARCVLAETGVPIDPRRFSYVLVTSYSWAHTAQGEFPGKTLAIIFQLEISTQELHLMSSGLSASEYEVSFGLQRFDRKRLLAEQSSPCADRYLR